MAHQAWLMVSVDLCLQSQVRPAFLRVGCLQSFVRDKTHQLVAIIIMMFIMIVILTLTLTAMVMVIMILHE
jgi:hypothetical protein